MCVCSMMVLASKSLSSHKIIKPMGGGLISESYHRKIDARITLNLRNKYGTLIMLNRLSNEEYYTKYVWPLSVVRMSMFRLWKSRLKVDVRLVTEVMVHMTSSYRATSSTCGLGIWIKAEHFMFSFTCCLTACNM